MLISIYRLKEVQLSTKKDILFSNLPSKKFELFVSESGENDSSQKG